MDEERRFIAIRSGVRLRFRLRLLLFLFQQLAVILASVESFASVTSFLRERDRSPFNLQCLFQVQRSPARRR